MKNMLLGEYVTIEKIKENAKNDTYKGIMKLNGEEIEAYIIDDDIKQENLNERYEGKVVAEFFDDEKDILVIDKKDSKVYYSYVKGYFERKKIELNMKCKCINEKSCGAVLYYVEDDGSKNYLAVKSKKGFWGFPKGHLEYGETEYVAAKREILEETGIKVSFQDGFREEISYKVGDYPIDKQVVFFLGQIGKNEKKDIKIQEEEIDEYSFFNFIEAKKALNEDLIKVLQKAEKYSN